MFFKIDKRGLYKKKTSRKSIDLQEINRVLEAGLEPARLLRPKDFKSFVSTDSTIRATLCFLLFFTTTGAKI